MNIIIPLCGEGQRFKDVGYEVPKPLIDIFDRKMIFHVIDNLEIDLLEDKLFIIYHTSLDDYNFSNLLKSRYPFVHLIPISRRTLGAAETILLGLDFISVNKISNLNKCLLIDCDTVYNTSILEKIRSLYDNPHLLGAVIYFKDSDCVSGGNALYSYITIDNNSFVKDIKEKEKISNNANTGAYYFSNILQLKDACQYVVSNDIRFKNEYYISCVIKHMLDISNNENRVDGCGDRKNVCGFKGIKINREHYVSLGTPNDVKKYIENQYSFLFDLDGTLVKTDKIYLNVWSDILKEYNIVVTQSIFDTFIQGNTDSSAMNQLKIDPSKYDIVEISKLKDLLFNKYIDQIEVISGAVDFIKLLKKLGYFICIVSNCNRDTCTNILKYLKIDKYCNYVIIGNECSRPKPYPDPYLEAIHRLKTVPERCIIFEDSKPGLLSAKSVSPRNIIGINNGNNLEVLKIFNLNLILDGFDKFCMRDCDSDSGFGVGSVDFGTGSDSGSGCGLDSSDYKDYNLDMLVNVKVDVVANIQDMILKSLASKYSIKNVHLNMQKLKGGYISDVIEVTIELNDNTHIDCVLKYENNYKSTLTSMAYKLDLYDREYYFYESISPYINICVPKYIGTVKDSNFISKGILLENIKREDFLLSLNLNQESIDVSLKVIEQCAKFHALFWNKDLSKSFNQLKKHNDPLFNPHWNDFIQSRWGDFSKRWNFIIKQDTLNKMEQIVGRFGEIQQELSDRNLTLCHGDVKSGNIFYKRDGRDRGQGQGRGGGGDTYMPYFIDWQYIAHGKGVQDIVFFMIESFDIQHIAEYGDLFKKYYYIKLREYGVTDYSLDDYNRDFNNAICYFPLFVAIWFGTTPNDDLIDVTFPFLFIQKLVFVIEKFL